MMRRLLSWLVSRMFSRRTPAPRRERRPTAAETRVIVLRRCLRCGQQREGLHDCPFDATEE